jgi:hypothetical protein
MVIPQLSGVENFSRRSAAGALPKVAAPLRRNLSFPADMQHLSSAECGRRNFVGSPAGNLAIGAAGGASEQNSPVTEVLL